MDASIPHPDQGRLVRSKATGQYGLLSAQIVHRGPYGKVTEVYVRPEGGGVEWTAMPEDIERVPDNIPASES